MFRQLHFLQIIKSVEFLQVVLADYCLTASKLHHGSSPKQLRLLAYDFATANNKEMPESWILNQTAGSDWPGGFLKHHQRLQACHVPPALIRTMLRSFFNNLQEVLEHYYHFSPNDTSNVDESRVTAVQKRTKDAAGRGTKQVGKMTSTERVSVVTMCCTVNATGGTVVPSFFVFPQCIFGTGC